jgi:hypothetical protein
LGCDIARHDFKLDSQDLSIHLSIVAGTGKREPGFGGRWSVVGGRWSVVGGRWSVVGGRWSVQGFCAVVVT